MASTVPFGFDRLSVVKRDNLLLAGILVLGAFLRLYHLGSLPPALAPGEASFGLAAVALLHHHANWLQGVSPLTALYIPWLSLGVALFGHTVVALRVAGAVFGIVSIWLIDRLATKWFDRRVGLVSALLLAASPWAITLSRNITPWSMLPAILTLVLLLATMAWQTRSSRWLIATTAVVVVSLYMHPIFWLVLVALLVALAVRPQAFKALDARGWLISMTILIIGLIPAAVSLIRHYHRITDWFAPTVFGTHATSAVSTLGHNVAKVLLMFNIHGDDNWMHNVAGQPMFNAFVGIMFLLGIIVSLVLMFRHWQHRAVLGLFVLGLLPAIFSLSGKPDAQRAGLSLVPALMLAAIGIGYMLDRWYATFPVNSAARTTGWAAMVLLLALSSYQGYVQYFTAWGGASQTHDAFDESGSAMATYLRSDTFSGQRVLVIGADNQKVISFLEPNFATKAVVVPATSITSFTTTATSHQFVIEPSQRDAAITALRSRFAGGKLFPHYSPFNNAELYYVYEVGK